MIDNNNGAEWCRHKNKRSCACAALEINLILTLDGIALIRFVDG